MPYSPSERALRLLDRCFHRGAQQLRHDALTSQPVRECLNQGLITYWRDTVIEERFATAVVVVKLTDRGVQLMTERMKEENHAN